MKSMTGIDGEDHNESFSHKRECAPRRERRNYDKQSQELNAAESNQAPITSILSALLIDKAENHSAAEHQEITLKNSYTNLNLTEFEPVDPL